MYTRSSSTTSLFVIGIPALICCICSAYHYYNYYNAKADLANISNSTKSKSESRPCIDNKTGIIYT